MKKIIFLISLLVLISKINYSQNRYTNLGDDDWAIKKNNYLFSVGYAAPSVVRSYLRLQTSRDKISISGFGPLLLKNEFMLSNRFGICLNGSFSYYKLSWQDDGYDTISKSYHLFEFGIRSYELAGTIRGNYHFWKREKIDSYAGIGMGYGLFHIWSYTYAHTTRFSIVYDLPPTLSLECTYGIKYFPTRHLGFFAEIGLGKSWILFDKYFIPEALIQAGTTLKL